MTAFTAEHRAKALATRMRNKEIIRKALSYQEQMSSSPLSSVPVSQPLLQSLPQHSSMEALKKQIIDQNEMLMLLKMNKELTKALTEEKPTLNQPSSVNDFLAQYNAIHGLRKGIKDEILEEIDEDEEYDDEGDIGSQIIGNILNPILKHGNNSNGSFKLGSAEAETAKAQVNQALGE